MKKNTFRTAGAVRTEKISNQKRIHVIIPEKLYDSLKELAFSENTTISEIVRVLCTEAIMKRN